MLKHLKRLARDQKGNILIMVAGGTAALVGSAGIAVDATQWYLWKRQMQQTVDSASMAGALSLNRSEDWEAAAKLALERTTNSDYTLETLQNPPSTGAYTGDNLAIEVIATTSRALPFSSVFMSSPATIRVRSVATAIGEGEHCVISLKKTGVGIGVSGSAQVNLGCGVAANSKSSPAVKLDGTSYLKAQPINAVGGIDYDPSNIDPNTQLLPYSNEVEDPLASRGLTVPSAPCDNSSKSGVAIAPSDRTTIGGNSNPNYAVSDQDGDGITKICGGLDVKGTLTMRPGVYIIDGGDFKINSGAKITGHDVTIILTGANAGKMANLDISGSATVDLTATDDDTSEWDGVLIYQDQIGSTHTSTINGGSNLGLEGIVYMPNGDVQFNGNAGQHADCLLLVASTVNFGGESSLDYDSSSCPFDTSTIENASKIIRVVE
ncbi:pilus assembly protein TadG-related protein [Altererythrobacter sp.]|uniref:pilus assembly protein TadG-related protein n=1 Tax=Altererythrobacter sp. TaxID=1872480 RepID=UPI003D10D5BB